MAVCHQSSLNECCCQHNLLPTLYVLTLTFCCCYSKAYCVLPNDTAGHAYSSTATKQQSCSRIITRSRTGPSTKLVPLGLNPTRIAATCHSQRSFSYTSAYTEALWIHQHSMYAVDATPLCSHNRACPFLLPACASSIAGGPRQTPRINWAVSIA